LTVITFIALGELKINLSKAHETNDNLSSSCLQIVLVYIQPFRRNSALKCASQPKRIKPSCR